MNKILNKIGFGGGCHWCTEAVFQQVPGVTKVEQGWVSSTPPNDSFSEAVIVHYDGSVSIETLAHVHLNTHSSESRHAMRSKYRSAIYYFEETSKTAAETYLHSPENSKIITQVLPFVDFRMNDKKYLDYYKKNPDAPFCTRYISPKLQDIDSLLTPHAPSQYTDNPASDHQSRKQ